MPGRLAAAAPPGRCPARYLALAACLVLLLAGDVAAQTTMRIRIAWGGGAERLWQGNVALTEGTLSNPVPLGIEADEPGSMWLTTAPTFVRPPSAELVGEAGAASLPTEHLAIRQRSPRTYDAVDLVVSAAADARLLVELVGADERNKPGWLAVPLSELVDGAFSKPLDDRGNSLLVERLADDDLRVELKHGSVVFAPGEILQFDLFAHVPAMQSGAPLKIQVELTPARGSQAIWSTELSAVAGQSAPIPQKITLPEEEGVYDVVIKARHPAGLRWPPSVAAGLKWKKPPLAERRLQVLVLRPEQPAAPLASGGESRPVVEEIDPANPKWWDRLAKLPHLRRSSRLPRGPLGNGNSRPIDHPLGQLVQLGPNPTPGDVAWEAYTLAIEEPGRPHVVELDYPSDVPQTLGISVIEPNAAGALFPIGLDSGIDQAEEIVFADEPPRWRTHRVVFWPRTKAPILLVTNRRDGSAAAYGKIRVRTFDGGQLPRAFAPGEAAPARLLAAYLDRPLFPENHNAVEALGSLSDLGVDDWVTFYEGGSRLVAYLDHVGYGGLMVAALADGSTIYPSRLLEPTPRYDTGAFLAAGQDPVRKDVLEMLLRMFDRDRLQLIPALEFAAPLPELEATLRLGGPESQGIRWIGPQGIPWTQVHPPVRGLAPYYNVLDPRVQQAMLSVVRELVRRYAHHASFAGLGIQLSAYGYAQLPGPEWGMDDATVARFEQQTGLKVPGSGPGRFAERAAWLTGQHREAWQAWRAQQLAGFYFRVRRELAVAGSDAKLYLAGATMFDGEQLRQALQPALPQQMTMARAMLHVGIDESLLTPEGRDTGIVLLRPEQVTPRWSLSSQAVNLVLRQMDDADRYFETALRPGSLFFHKPQELRLASFDERSPFSRSYTWLATQTVPSGEQNRRRFVHSLASLDSQVIFDGGWELSMGQQASLADLVATYRRLPAVRFEKFTGRTDGLHETASQPVTVRYAVYKQSTYLYAVNEAPFATTARLQLACPTPCQLEELSGRRQVAQPRAGPLGTSWSVRLEPYDVVAVRLSSPSVKLVGVEASWPDEVQKTLKSRIAELGDRAASLRNPPLLRALSNSGFEHALDSTGRIPGWAASHGEGVSVGLDAGVRHDGAKSLRIASTGAVATLISEPFDAPATGRLTMRVWLRTSEASPQPPLQVALVGKCQGHPLFYSARLRQPAGADSQPKQVAPQWEYMTIEFPGWPLEHLVGLQLRFDLLGPGEVWIDDVQLSALAFSKTERVELFKLIAPADLRLQQGQVGDCLDLLESYWPRFLLANVPAVERLPAPVPHSPASPGVQPPDEAVQTGFLDRMKDRLPDWLRF